MSFFVLKLVIAALVIGLLAIAALILRQTRRKRQSGSGIESLPPAAKASAKAPKAPKRKAAEQPEPEPDTPPIARRRQLTSFAESERSLAQAEAEALGLPIADRAEPEPDLFAPEPEPEPEPLIADAPPPEPAAHSEPDQPEFDQIVMDRLEAAFEALQAEEISLDAYRELVLAEEAAVEEHIAHHQETGDEIALEAGLAARESVRWCLDWADERGKAEHD